MPRSPPLTIALLVLVSVAVCAVAAATGAWYFHHKDPSALPLRPDQYLSMGWVAWDSSWYKLIAEQGYSYTPGHQSPVAFFPLYPLAIRLFMELGLNTYVAGIAVTLLCGPLAMVLFTRWACTRVDPATALQAGMLISLYPFAFYLYGVMYSDALFLLLVVSAFLLLEKGYLLPAVLLGALATAARPVAPAVVLGLLVRRLEWKRERGLRWNAGDMLPLLSAAGFIVYLLYLREAFGSPFAFVETQGSPGWDQAPGWRTWLKLAWFQAVFFSGNNAEVVGRFITHALLTLLALGMVWPTARKLGWGYAVFTLAIVGLPALSTKDFMGMGRYLLSAFPLFLTFAVLLRERPRLRHGLLAASAVGLVLLSAAFGMDRYVS
ncbi:mannosyltransferase family protein [Stigmatella sp. ncwal1]|uniref:Mannosyltransferase family protein n=2 Tax=Stigmatella ashevillensis TaxID=2995309 RepID=A0ABT5D702_9BACT|nr:mannosyltransferase family protein [Stigmatella ashevillena]MDC0709432.1 mannosyltransferase family protein [Stigmatella ashevillena]